MSYTKRQINLQFSSAAGVVYLEGLRCAAIITNPGGYNAFASLELRVEGMSLEHMNQFSSTGANAVAAQNFGVTVLAGDEGAAIGQVFSGTVFRSFIDFGSPPDVGFVCSATSGYIDKVRASAANSYPGAQAAETIIATLAQSLGYTFQNPKGAHAILQNHYCYGSAMDQIMGIARAAAFPITVENNTVTIWPNNGVRDDVTINLGPGSGLVGYPSFWEAGFIVRSEFNPLIANGRTVNLTSSIPKANGSWPTQTVTHELSTLTPDGPWFTTARLAPAPYVPVN